MYQSVILSTIKRKVWTKKLYDTCFTTWRAAICAVINKRCPFNCFNNEHFLGVFWPARRLKHARFFLGINWYFHRGTAELIIYSGGFNETIGSGPAWPRWSQYEAFCPPPSPSLSMARAVRSLNEIRSLSNYNCSKLLLIVSLEDKWFVLSPSKQQWQASGY